MQSKILLHKVRIFFIFSLFLNSSLFLFAQTTASEKIVKIGYYENEVFQEGSEPGSIKKGYAYEYYRKLSEYTGWKYEYIYGDFIDLYKMLEEGRIDLLAGLTYSEARAEKILYQDAPMGSTRYYLMKRNDDLSISADIESLNGKKIGILNSSMSKILQNWLSNNEIEAEVHIYNSETEKFDAFDKCEVDTVLIEGTGTYGRKDSSIFLYVGSSDYYLCVNKNKPELLVALNKAYRLLINDEPNYFSTLYSKYSSNSALSRAFSSDEIDYINKNKEITIGYLIDYLPYCDIDENGQLKGFLRELIPDILDKLGLSDSFTIQYEPYESFSHMITALDENIIDVAFPVGGGLYFSEKGDFYQSHSVIDTSVALVFNGEYEKKESIKFAVNKNNSMQYYYVKSNFPDAAIDFYESIEECLYAILKGEADYVTVNGLRVNNLLKNSKYKNLQYRLLGQSDQRCFGVKIGNENLLRILNRGINAVGEQYILNKAYPYTEDLFHYSITDYIKNVLYVIIPIILIAGLIILLYNLKTEKRLRILNLKLEAALKNRDRYIADMIRYATSEADADKILNQLVEYIGKNTHSDRVYVFEENKSHAYDNTYEWCNKGISKEKDNLQNVPYKGVIELWINEFKKNGIVIIKELESYKQVSKAIYDILKPQNINTLVAIPLKVKGKIIGFIGVDNVPVNEIDDVAEFLTLVEFFFSLMIRLRNGVISLSDIASHDQLTGFYNRRAYQEDKDEYRKNGLEDSFVYVSIDINGLKIANDSIGHEAGDELIVGACDCMRECFGPYGRLYRTGGDEFIAFINVSDEELEQIKINLQKACDNWSGKLVEHLSLSCGYVSAKENKSMGLHEMTVLADKRMYEEKSKYYRKSGIDRRGQRDAHVALCALYTKILKINLHDDSYQIINMDVSEQTKETGFSDKISDWLRNFGTSGQVHADDLELFLERTDIDYIRNYIAENKKPLRVFYRRKYKDSYKQVMMEMIPTNDYSEENQSLFLYVKDID